MFIYHTISTVFLSVFQQFFSVFSMFGIFFACIYCMLRECFWDISKVLLTVAFGVQLPPIFETFFPRILKLYFESVQQVFDICLLASVMHI